MLYRFGLVSFHSRNTLQTSFQKHGVCILCTILCFASSLDYASTAVTSEKNLTSMLKLHEFIIGKSLHEWKKDSGVTSPCGAQVENFFGAPLTKKNLNIYQYICIHSKLKIYNKINTIKLNI